MAARSRLYLAAGLEFAQRTKSRSAVDRDSMTNPRSGGQRSKDFEIREIRLLIPTLTLRLRPRCRHEDHRGSEKRVPFRRALDNLQFRLEISIVAPGPPTP